MLLTPGEDGTHLQVGCVPTPGFTTKALAHLKTLHLLSSFLPLVKLFSRYPVSLFTYTPYLQAHRFITSPGFWERSLFYAFLCATFRSELSFRQPVFVTFTMFFSMSAGWCCSLFSPKGHLRSYSPCKKPHFKHHNMLFYRLAFIAPPLRILIQLIGRLISL